MALHRRVQQQIVPVDDFRIVGVAQNGRHFVALEPHDFLKISRAVIGKAHAQALPRRLYPKEFKINAVHLVQVEGRRACDVADELGIGRQTLYSWLHEARTGVLSGTSENAREITPQEAEIARLKSELARKEQEILLLKKFAAYLSSTGLK